MLPLLGPAPGEAPSVSHVPIPGTNHKANVEQNAAVADLQIPQEDIDRLSEIFAIGAGAGERYTPNALKGVGL